MYENLKGNPLNLKPNSVHQVHRTLRKALNDADKKRIILQNPIKRLLEIPAIHKKDIVPLSITELNRFLSLDDKWTPLFTLLVKRGLLRVRLQVWHGAAWT